MMKILNIEIDCMKKERDNLILNLDESKENSKKLKEKN